MAWIGFVTLLAIAIGVVVALGLARPLWSFVGAGLMLAGVGYAVQGRPALPAHPAAPPPDTSAADPGMIEMRDAMFGTITAERLFLAPADALQRTGDQRGAVQVLLAGIDRMPRSALLWAALGNAMTAHDGDTLSPPATFAFQRALRLAPNHPGPPFLYGIAAIRAGNYPLATVLWQRALDLSPSTAPYRQPIMERLAIMQMMVRQPGDAPPP